MGRPREFDPDQALARAVELFWEKGYEGASLGELTEVMGITRPSLYGTYGNKEELFRKALNFYDEHFMGFIGKSLQEPTARQVVEHLLFGYVDSQTLPDHPWGCLGVHGAQPGSESDGSMHHELAARRNSVRTALRDRLRTAQKDGDLSASASPDDMAMLVMLIAQGSAMQARAGSSRSELRRAVALTVATLPLDAGSSVAKPPIDKQPSAV